MGILILFSYSYSELQEAITTGVPLSAATIADRIAHGFSLTIKRNKVKIINIKLRENKMKYLQYCLTIAVNS